MFVLVLDCCVLGCLGDVGIGFVNWYCYVYGIVLVVLFRRFVGRVKSVSDCLVGLRDDSEMNGDY